jgi:hypothetical protein
LKGDLVAAMKGRDKPRVETIRALIGAIDNAGAVATGSDGHEPKLGLGHDVARREITSGDEQRILAAELEDLMGAAAEFRELGETGRSEELEKRAGIVSGYLEPPV